MMNDFTKEELKQLLSWRDNVKYTKKPDSKLIICNTKLGVKIQSMIENYCDHEYEYQYDFGKDPRSRYEKSANPMCKKCQKIMNDQQSEKLNHVK